MVNKIILIGNLGDDPKIRDVGENKVCQFSIATTESYKKNGEWQNDTTWHNIVVWSKNEHAAHSYRKGDQIFVEGKQVNRSYEKDGKTYYISEVRAITTKRLKQAEAKEVERKELTNEDIFPENDAPW